MAHTFKKGHRIRLAVASSNFPQYDRNLNTGGPIGRETIDKAITVTNAVYHDALIEKENGTVSGDVDHFTKFAILAVEKSELSDIPEPEAVLVLNDIEGHWAEPYIFELIAKKAITGYSDYTFRPDDQISRAEFTSILVKVLGLEPRAGHIFNDTKQHWAKDVIASANAHGIVNGFNNTTFRPDDQITREQMAIMLVNALDLKHERAKEQFTDFNKVSDWAVEAVETAISAGLIQGYEDGSIRSFANATRAEAATILVRAFNK